MPSQPPLSQLPQFYFPTGQAVSETSRKEFQQRIDKHYEASPSGMGIEQFAAMAQEVRHRAEQRGSPQRFLVVFRSRNQQSHGNPAAVGRARRGVEARDVGHPGSRSRGGAAASCARPQLCDLPRMVGRTLFRKLAGPEGAALPKEDFLRWWAAHSMLSAPTIKRVYEVLRQDGRDVSAAPAALVC